MPEAWKIPMADPFIGEEEARAVYDVVLSGWLSAGPKVPEFERRFADLVGVHHAIAFCNGTVALHSILIALGIGAGAEVIVPDITFISSATSVLHAGALPAFVDVEAQTLGIDPDDIERRITPRTKAIMPVHYAGQSADLDPVLEIAARYNLAVIEDAAEAHAAEYKGRKVGSFGRAAMFSFTPNKNMTTGEGGIVTTNDAQLASQLRMLRNHGSSAPYVYDNVGYNYRMTEMQAALGIEQLKKLSRIITHKHALAAAYTARLEACPGIEPPTALADRTHTYQMYTIRVNPQIIPIARDQLCERLAAEGIQTRVCFPALHRQPIFAAYANAHASLHNSAQIADEILSLPINGKMTDANVNFVCDCIEKAMRV